MQSLAFQIFGFRIEDDLYLRTKIQRLFNRTIFIMKTQKLTKMAHQIQTGKPIVTILDFNGLNDIQKMVSVSMYSMNRLNSPNFIFSIEDVFHPVSRKELMQKDIFNTTEFLAAHIIPFKVQLN
jgi:hypothetical protein